MLSSSPAMAEIADAISASFEAALPPESRLSRIAIDPASAPGAERVFVPTADGGGIFYVLTDNSKVHFPIHQDTPLSCVAFVARSGALAVALDESIAFGQLTAAGESQRFTLSKPFRVSQSPIQSMAATGDADNTLLACGSSGELRILDVTNLDDPKVVNVFSRLPGNTWACAWSPDSKHLAFAAKDRLMLWGVNHQLREVTSAFSEINAIAWSAKDPLLALGTAAGRIMLLNTETWVSLGLSTPFQKPVSSLAFSAKGDFLGATCWETREEHSGLISIWGTEDWEMWMLLKELGGNRREFPPSIGFLSHSETMVSLRDGNGGIRETEVDQFVSPLQQAVQSERKLRKRLIAGGDVKDAVQSLSLMIQNMQNPLIREAEESLLLMEGKVFNSIEEMKSFVSSLSAMLKPLEMRIRCPSGKYAGAPARLSVTLSGRSREPRFCYLVQVDGAIKSVTDHANGMRVPKLSLCRAPLDGRRKNFE